MEQNSQSTESLYDFIYLDRDKLAAFSAQLFKDGTLVSLKTQDRLHQSAGSEMSSGLKPIFSAAEKDNLTTIRGIEMQFDTGWALPLNVLNKLDELGFIKRSLLEAEIGDLVVFSGSINIMDLGMLRELWEPIAEMQSISTQPKTQTSAIKRKAEQDKKMMKSLVSIFKCLPHSIQLRIFNDEEQAWSTLRRDCLTINPEDLVLKHGHSIQGEWHCLAIMDGKPELLATQELNFPSGASELELAMWEMSAQIKNILGRNPMAYGLTPISLFRSV